MSQSLSILTSSQQRDESRTGALKDVVQLDGNMSKRPGKACGSRRRGSGRADCLRSMDFVRHYRFHIGKD